VAEKFGYLIKDAMSHS